MLPYKDTKLRSRRRSREGHVYIHSAKIPLTRAPVSVAYNGATISCRGGAPAPSQKVPIAAIYVADSVNQGISTVTGSYKCL